MSETTLEDQVAANGTSDEPEPEPKPLVAESSQLARLRKKRAEVLADRHATLDLEIPGYDGELVCRYTSVSWDELKKLGVKVEKIKSPRQELYGFMDTLILACEGFYVREEGNPELQPLDPDDPAPIKYDERLVSALELKPKQKNSARAIVLETFGLAVNPELAITGQFTELGEWMEGANQEADEELLGES